MDIDTDQTEQIVRRTMELLKVIDNDRPGVQLGALCNALAYMFRRVPEENMAIPLEVMTSAVRSLHILNRVALAEPVVEPPHDAASSPHEENDNAGPERS